MSRRDDNVTLRQMLDHVQEAIKGTRQIDAEIYAKKRASKR